MVGPPRRNDAGRLMQRVPPIDRELDDRDVDGADQREDGGGAAGAARLLDRLPQRDQAEIEQEQHQHRGEPRVPHPIGAPHRLAPERAGDQRDEGEGGADRRRGLGGDVGQRMAPDQRAERRRRRSAYSRTWRARPHGTWMNMILHGLALLVVGRRHEEGKIEADAEQDQPSAPRATARRGRPGSGNAWDWRG